MLIALPGINCVCARIKLRDRNRLTKCAIRIPPMCSQFDQHAWSEFSDQPESEGDMAHPMFKLYQPVGFPEELVIDRQSIQHCTRSQFIYNGAEIVHPKLPPEYMETMRCDHSCIGQAVQATGFSAPGSASIL